MAMTMVLCTNTEYVLQQMSMSGQSDFAPPLPRRRMITESFVISFDAEHVHKFIERNKDIASALWVHGVHGFHQPALEMWAKMTGTFPVINASLFDAKSQEDKDNLRSPHAVGCYLAHWHLLRSFQHREPALQPDLYVVFEDDATCVPDLVNRTLEATRKLPPNWDIFFIGGKPFTFFPPERMFAEGHNLSRSTLRHDICQGIHGMGDSPLAPDGSRQLSVDQPYWQIKYMTNTHAYVVNPQRVDQVLSILEPRENQPIDIRLAEAMQRGELNAYMPTQNWCSGGQERLHHPETWWGYYYIPGVGFVKQEKMLLENCSY
jgi:GR25 family glycosyltransferase involved in LPS biosynthesis